VQIDSACVLTLASGRAQGEITAAVQVVGYHRVGSIIQGLKTSDTRHGAGIFIKTCHCARQSLAHEAKLGLGFAARSNQR
jgi:hypothetical protein